MFSGSCLKPLFEQHRLLKVGILGEIYLVIKPAQLYQRLKQSDNVYSEAYIGILMSVQLRSQHFCG